MRIYHSGRYLLLPHHTLVVLSRRSSLLLGPQQRINVPMCSEDRACSPSSSSVIAEVNNTTLLV
jgi:hypothetical protein